MNEAEFNLDDIFAEAEDVLANNLLLPSAQEDVFYPSEFHARDARIAFEHSIQRPYILSFFEGNPRLLSQPKGRGRTAKFRDEIFGYLKTQVTVLRSCNKNAEADVLERTDSEIIGDIVRQQIADEVKRLGRQFPGTGGYSNIDSRIKFLNRWERLCDELIDLERDERDS